MTESGSFCKKCGCTYSYKAPGERCGDRSHMYTATSAPPIGHPGCDGVLAPYAERAAYVRVIDRIEAETWGQR